jgi:hypothetical protein
MQHRLRPERGADASALDLESVIVDEQWLALASTLNLARGGAVRLDLSVPYGQNAKRILWRLFPELKEKAGNHTHILTHKHTHSHKHAQLTHMKAKTSATLTWVSAPFPQCRHFSPILVETQEG